MKKILITFAGYAFYALGISAQSFVGTWKSDEIIRDNTKGFVSFVFEPQSKVTEVFDVFAEVGDGVKIKIRCEVPGLYLIESGKAMTLILDRNKAAVTGHEIDYGNFFADNGITGAKIDEAKKVVEQLWNTRLKSQLEPTIVKIMPFSHICQLLYCDGETFLIASPQSDLWNNRYEFHRVNSDAQAESHRVDWVTDIEGKEYGNSIDEEKENILVDEEEEIFQVVEEMPEFPGGMDKMLEYIGKNIKYPSDAKEQGIQGRSIIEFVVNKDGSIVDPKVVRSLHPKCDEEAMRVIKTMPKWKPGKQRGKPVRVKYTVPVQFKLSV